MGQDKTLNRGARALGTAALSVLALLSLGWIVRDFVAANKVVDVWWTWSGLPARATDGLWATSFVEPTLLILYVVCAVTAARTASAAGVLGSAGVLTLLLRAPSLWNLHSDWMQVVDGELKRWAFVSAIAMVVLGAVLVLAAALGRRPVASGGTGPYYAWEDDTPPARPTRGGGVTAFLLLGTAAAGLVAWELRTAADQGWTLYQRALSGEDVLVALLSVPGSWYGWVTAILSLVAACAAVGRAPYARPLGMTAGGALVGLGLFYTSYALKMRLFEHLGEHSVLEQLRLVLALFEIVAGVLALCVLAPRGEADEDDGFPRVLGRGYGPGTGPGYSPPPPANPPANW